MTRMIRSRSIRGRRRPGGRRMLHQYGGRTGIFNFNPATKIKTRGTVMASIGYNASKRTGLATPKSIAHIKALLIEDKKPLTLDQIVAHEAKRCRGG